MIVLVVMLSIYLVFILIGLIVTMILTPDLAYNDDFTGFSVFFLWPITVFIHGKYYVRKFNQITTNYKLLPYIVYYDCEGVVKKVYNECKVVIKRHIDLVKVGER